MFIIRFKIAELLEKYMLSQRKIALECNIRPTTLKMYVDNTVKRINVEDIMSLYNFFYNFDDRIKLTDIVDIENNNK